MPTARPQPRRQLHGYVSSEAADGWNQFAASQGTNVSALMEALGPILAAHADIDKLPPVLAGALKEARLVASSRSSRRRAD